MNLPSFGQRELSALLPFAILALGGTLTSLLGAWRSRFGAVASAIVLALAALALPGAIGAPALWEGALVFDRLAAVFTALLLVAGLFAILLSEPVLRRENRVRAEYYGLLLFSLSGMVLLVSTTNLLMLFLALELLGPGPGQEIIFAHPAFVGELPLGADESVPFQAVEDGIEHGLGPFQYSAGDEFDPLEDAVAVVFSREKEGEDDRLGRCGDESF